MQQRVLVCRSWPHVLALPHVLQIINLLVAASPR